MISEITLFAIEQAYAMDNMVDSFNDAMSVPDFVAGLIYGFTGNNHLDDLQGCMEDISPLEEDAENFISHLTHGKIIEAIQDVGDVIWMLPDAVEGCDNADVN